MILLYFYHFNTTRVAARSLLLAVIYNSAHLMQKAGDVGTAQVRSIREHYCTHADDKCYAMPLL